MARRILIVEDDKHFASQLAELMEFQGLDPLTRHSGPAGIDAFRAVAVDLVLLDVMLPNVHGIRVLEAIRGLPGGSDVPVLLMSAVYRSESLFQRDIERLGVSGFLSKPFSLLELGRRIETLLASPGNGRTAVRDQLALHASQASPPAAATRREAADVPSAAFPKAATPARAPTPPSIPEIPAIMRQAPRPAQEQSIAPVDTGRRLPSAGILSAEQYVRILATLFHAHSSGRLILDGDRGRRTFFLLNGYPVWLEADDPMDGLPRYLHEEAILSGGDIVKLADWVATRRGSIRSGLVELGLVSAPDLPALMEAWVTAEVRDGLGDGLGDGGRFEFHAGDDFAGSRPVYEVNPIRAVCSGLARHLPISTARKALEAFEGRMLGRTRTFNRLFGYVGSTPELRNLGEFLLRPRSVAEVRGRFGADNDYVARTLWFLVHAGLVALSDSPQPARAAPSGRRTREARSVPGAPAARPKPPPPPDLDTRRISRDVVAHVVDRAQQAQKNKPRSAVKPEDLATQIVRDYVTRIDLDHYGFLGVKRTATAAEIDAAYQALAPRYRLRNLSVELQGDVRRQAKELLARLVQAFDELSSPNRRAAYDTTLSVGPGQSPRPSRPAARSGTSAVDDDLWFPGQDDPDFVERQCRRLGSLEADKFRRAQERMSKGEFGAAYSIFEELRGRYPSEGAILAALGWCRHTAAPKDPRGLDKALEWVDLALAFQPDALLALEARARILVDAEDPRADDAVKRVLRRTPTNIWARDAARKFAAAKDDTVSTRTGVLRSLWGKRR